MAQRRDLALLERIGRELGKAAVKRARPQVRKSSRTLARAMSVVRPTQKTTWVYIPHYWAIMVHEGRQPFSKPNAMVWFRDPRKDPRLPTGSTPQRVSQLKHLTRRQYLYWLDQNRKADPTGLNPQARPMIVTKKVTRPTPPNKFFDNREGMRGFREDANKVVKTLFLEHLEATVPGVGRVLRDEAVLVLPRV